MQLNTTADFVTALLAYAEKVDPEQGYDYESRYSCPIAQMLSAQGIKGRVDIGHISSPDLHAVIPYEIDQALSACSGPYSQYAGYHALINDAWKWGKLVERLKAIPLDTGPVTESA